MSTPYPADLDGGTSAAKIASVQGQRVDEGPDRERDADRQTKALAGLALVLALVVVALFLIKHLRVEGELEDCLLAQRTNCDALIDHER